MDQSRYLSRFSFSTWAFRCKRLFSKKSEEKEIKENHSIVKKRRITLIEVLLAVVLSAIIITTLLSFFTQVTKIEHRMERATHEVEKRENLQVRAQQMFSSLLPAGLCPEDTPPFYTPDLKESPQGGVKIVFDHGVDPDPIFSGPVRAHLYVDKEKNFICEIFPLSQDKKNVSRKDILWPKAQTVEMQFFGKSDNKYEWKKRWKKENGENIPPMLKLRIEGSDHMKREFAFFLPASHTPIIYSKTKGAL